MKKKITLVVIITTLILSTSCGKKPMKVDQKEKAPESIFSVSEGIDHIMKKIEQLENTKKLTEEEIKADDPKEKDNPLLKEDVLLKQWTDIDEEIIKAHKNWNIYEVDAIKEGANLEKTKAFKENINLLTIAIENRETMEIIDKGSKTFLSLSFFFDLYKDDSNGDLFRIKYKVYQGYLTAMNGNIMESESLLVSTDEYITRLRQKLDKDKNQIKNLDRLSLSIEDMKIALKENNRELLKIKKDIIIKNIDLLDI